MSKAKKPEEEPPPPPTAEEISLFLEKLDGRAEHIENVQRAARKMALRLAKSGEFVLARRLVQRAYRHDNSKFSGIEWEYLELDEKDEKMKAIAAHQHQQQNDHHPEHFPKGISEMTDAQIAEMVCDWWARSTEQGKDLREWTTKTAAERFGYTLRSVVWKKIKRFVDLLLEPELKQLNHEE